MESNRRYVRENKELVASKKKAYAKANKDKIAKQNKNWSLKNQEHRKSYKRQYQEKVKERKRNDPEFRFLVVMRSRICTALKGFHKNSKTKEFLGAPVAEVRRHIESLWTTDMSWENYGLKGWTIDHKIPCTSFSLEDPEEQKRCFHFSNLRPLWNTTEIAIQHGEPVTYIGNCNKHNSILI